MEHSPCIDYEEFLAKRYDLVVRYTLLSETDFDVPAAKRLVTKSKKYTFLREAYRELWPVLSKKFDKGLIKKYGHDHGLAIAHNQFFMKHYEWLEDAICNKFWLIDNPYGVRPDNKGIPTKRFLMALKCCALLYWTQEPFMVGYKTIDPPTQMRGNYKKLLTPKQFNMFEGSKKRMMERMRMLRFFYLDSRVHVTREEFKK